MSVTIRLSRKGTNKRPFYRIVAADRTKPRDGRYLELLGTYDPKAKEKAFTLKKDRYDNWIQKGALPSRTISQLVQRASQNVK
ncbi:MAG: 30S ribosomal protein S16 [Deltaproteobacteria bacterium]|nr:30S ribosomal protein S16 [Deltaproteobacteria bacterium]